MRKNIIAGNWKMNKNLNEGIELAKEVNKLVNQNVHNNVEIILAPPFIHLTEINKIIDKKRINLAAQNCSKNKNGAYTGEISAEMIVSTGATHVIVGHSERREYQREDNPKIYQKILRAIENNLSPIFCCGEKLLERKAGNHFNVIEEQMIEGISNISSEDFKNLIIAYEPVWAIGTGLNATPEQAQEMHNYIRNLINDRYGEDISDNTTILYGGSCKPSNAHELFAKPDVDGGLIGGASLIAQNFIDIINSF